MPKYGAVEHWAKIEVGLKCGRGSCGAALVSLEQCWCRMHAGPTAASACPPMPQVPADAQELQAVRQRLAARYPLAAFNVARRRLDPKNVLGSPMVDALLPRD